MMLWPELAGNVEISAKSNLRVTVNYHNGMEVRGAVPASDSLRRLLLSLTHGSFRRGIILSSFPVSTVVRPFLKVDFFA